MKAERLADAGDMWANVVYAEAAELEEKALAAIPASAREEREIIAISASCLWFQSGSLDRAEKGAQELLRKRSLSDYARSAVLSLQGLIKVARQL